ncbi:AraC family transcriptional regulator [Aeromicrobium sp. IC_218]|uniref:AraC family transcriptional regulator n=1 Tax=Aeromicrobium sp. IC_218 TaxID=2545468 RepID=UPI001A9562E7|nr:AraC family transcriptional regulator [Aeromicrobium sp. IC_218]
MAGVGWHLTLRDNYLTLDDMSYIRSAGLRGFARLVTEHGGDPEAMARRARLPLQALHDDELLVEDLALARVLELAAAELDLPDLGLRLAERQDLAMLGPLAVAIQNSPTLGDALACSARYLFVHARGLSLEAVPDPHGTPGLVALRYGTPAGDVFRQGADVGLGFLHRSICALHGGGYGLRGVELPHRPLAPVSRYEEWFGAPVRVGEAQALLRVPASLMTRPLDDADVTVRTLALEHLGRYADSPGSDVTMRVRAVLEESLGTTTVDVAAVASLLAVHPRTLQRRLEAEGTTFARVLDGLRRERARTYLTTTDMPMTQVAAALGLSEQSALTRCARRWWGQSPREVRAASAV